MWFVGDCSWCLLFPVTSATCSALALPACSLMPPSSLVVASSWCYLCLFLPALTPSSMPWMATSGGASLLLLGAG
jgi:hypothetical protein